MMKEAVYQAIYEELNQYLMTGWEKLVVYLEYGEASYSFSFFVKIGKDYIKCYDIPNLTEDALTDSYRKIDRLVSAERNKEKELWSNMTMVAERTGSLHVDFDYTDLSAGTYQYKRDWKKKYLV